MNLKCLSQIVWYVTGNFGCLNKTKQNTTFPLKPYKAELISVLKNQMSRCGDIYKFYKYF